MVHFYEKQGGLAGTFLWFGAMEAEFDSPHPDQKYSIVAEWYTRPTVNRRPTKVANVRIVPMEPILENI